MTTALSINLNKIALIRNSRDTSNPSVVDHAEMCVDAGADGITVHPRPDQRHIRASDCYALSHMLDVEFNIEGNPFAPACKSNRKGVSDYPGFMQLIREIKPEQVTFVPDTDEQLTSDHGFDMRTSSDKLRPLIEECHDLGVRVSLFMDPDAEQIKLAKAAGADRVELYTGPYAWAYGNGSQDLLSTYVDAGRVAEEIGIGVNAGHDLDLQNLPDFAANVPNLLEVSIGHAFIVDCIRLGLDFTVASYQHALGKA
ncbi:MAG: pyridoxine 5-phosphate synthase [Pseudoalteromonas tetraodonis]|jgi:pyridoxine 5-phosphate synthase